LRGAVAQIAGGARAAAHLGDLEREGRSNESGAAVARREDARGCGAVEERAPGGDVGRGSRLADQIARRGRAR
jgi:hypothetical protein